MNFSTKKQGEARIMIYNNIGSLVKEFTHSTSTGQNIASFNVRGWNQGVYLVRVVSDSESDTVRLIVAE